MAFPAMWRPIVRAERLEAASALIIAARHPQSRHQQGSQILCFDLELSGLGQSEGLCLASNRRFQCLRGFLIGMNPLSNHPQLPREIIDELRVVFALPQESLNIIERKLELAHSRDHACTIHRGAVVITIAGPGIDASRPEQTLFIVENAGSSRRDR
jgi:hypothetical protein